MDLPKSSEQSSSSSDEIDLVALIEILWKGKWLVALIAIIAIFAGFGYHKTLNRSVTASLRVEQLNPAKMSSINTLNELKLIEKLDPNSLLELDYEYLSSFDNAKRLFESRKPVDESLEGEELRQSVMAYAGSNIHVSLKRPRMVDSFRPYIQVEIKDDQMNELKPMLESFVSWASDQTKATLVRQFSVAIQEREKQRDLEVERIRVQIKGLTEKYYAEKNDQIEVLNNRISTIREIHAERKNDQIARMKEQAEIARNLGIAKPVETNYDVLPDNAVITQFSTVNQPLYLRGYLALENQIELELARENDDSFILGLREAEEDLLSITSRKDDKAYISNLRTLEESIFILQNDPFINYAKDIVDKLLCENSEFRFVGVDLDGVSFKKLSGIKILLSAGILGVGIGVAIVLLLAAVRYRKSVSIRS